jgi:hypothetical protein
VDGLSLLGIDREKIGKGSTELTDALIWAGRFQEATETARRGLAYLQGEVSADRARLLAALGEAHAATAGYGPAREGLREGLNTAFQLSVAGFEPENEALREALNIAFQLSDPKLVASLLAATAIVNFHFFRLREAAADGLLSEQLGGSEASPWQRALQLRILLWTLLYLGRLEEALRIADELEPLAMKIGQSLSVAFCLSTRAWTDFVKAPDLAKLGAGFQRVQKSEREASYAHLEVFFEVQLSLLDFFRGNWTGALSHAGLAPARSGLFHPGVRRRNAFSTAGLCRRSRRRTGNP